jgi:hypothetical protein
MGWFDCIYIYVADVVEKAKALDIRQSNLAYHNSTICLLSFTLIQILKQVKDLVNQWYLHLLTCTCVQHDFHVRLMFVS